MRDIFNNIHPLRAISPVSVTDNTAQISQIIDRQGYDALTFVIATGSIADADATFAGARAPRPNAHVRGVVFPPKRA